MQDSIHEFIDRQLASWQDAAQRFANLDSAEFRNIDLPGYEPYRIMFNPSRIASSAAKVDAASIAARPCFLCRANHPEQQLAIEVDEYEILVNPFPIFPRHLTIPTKAHTPQVIENRAKDMAMIALKLRGFTLFYNGAKCGASAPDHFHFQAAPKEHLPIREDYPFLTCRFFATVDSAELLMNETLAKLPGANQQEPPVNILCSALGNSEEVEFVVIPRRAHRPKNFGTNPGQLLISPASADLAGTIVAPRRQEFDAIDTATLLDLFSQLCYPHE